MKRDITFVFGKTGSGKTTFVREHIFRLDRVIILDPLEEYGGPIADDPEEIVDYIEGREKFQVRSNDIESFPLLCDTAKAARNVSLVIEEAQRIIPPSSQRLPEELRELIFRGRHYGVSLVFSSQRPITLHIDARSQWTRIVSFNQSEPSDYAWIEHTSGYDMTGSFDLRRLKVPGEYVDITPGTCEKKTTRLVPLSFAEKGKRTERGERSLEEIFRNCNSQFTN